MKTQHTQIKWCLRFVTWVKRTYFKATFGNSAQATEKQAQILTVRGREIVKTRQNIGRTENKKIG